MLGYGLVHDQDLIPIFNWPLMCLTIKISGVKDRFHCAALITTIAVAIIYSSST